jgi:eukaryotic-like serine/threonine-protein kinase
MVEGTNLQRRYRLDHRIAVGGMGAVYEALDERLGRRVAVKVLKTELAHDPRFVERFRREARAIAALSHPNIANVYDYGEDNDSYFIVMEYASGEDLARLLRAVGPLAPDRAIEIASQMSAALAHAHAAGIVHRDVKPGNVIVDPGDRVKVTDFGIARAAGDSTLTATGSILGTAQYLSPEQAAGGPHGPACDIYATGIVLYEMLTGEVPFTGESAVAVAMRHISDPVPPPSRLVAGVGPALDAVIARATAKEPRDRYPDAETMERALRDLALPVGETTLPGTSAETLQIEPIPGEGWSSRRLGRALLITFGILLLLAAAALGWSIVSDNEVAAPGRNGRERPGAGGRATTTPTPDETTPASFEITESIIGSNIKDTEKVLTENGFTVEKAPVESDAEKDTVVDVDPDVGTAVTPGVDTITLYVSTGPAKEDEGDEGEEGPPEEPPGQDKKEDDDG